MRPKARTRPVPTPDAAIRVRPFEAGDLPGVVELHRLAFPESRMAGALLADHLTSLLIDHPWADPSCPSLVCEDRDGRVLGALGVMPRPMELTGRRILAAVGHNFMVDTRVRAGLAAIRLLQAFFAGPQEVSLAEANAPSRRLWMGLHGSTALEYSLRWLRPLAPARHLVRLGVRPAGAARLLDPLARLADRAAARWARNPYGPPSADLTGGPLDAETLAAGLWGIAQQCALRPVYDLGTLRWLIDTLRRRRTSGEFHQVAVRGRRGTVAGWYLYFLRPGGAAEVVQLAAWPESMGCVFDHLLAHAYERGATAVGGRVDPLLFPTCVERRCLFQGEPWMLVHGADPDVLNAIHAGDAFLTPLEGEGWIGA